MRSSLPRPRATAFPLEDLACAAPRYDLDVFTSPVTDNPNAFPATRWTMIDRLRSPTVQKDFDDTVSEMCRRYWRPLYAFARRTGLSHEDSEDATQAFFATALRRDLFLKADPARGRLRSLLLTAFQRTVWQNKEKQQSAKRGGLTHIASLDEMMDAGVQISGISSATSPEAVFHRYWALEVLRSTDARLEAHYTGLGKSPEFKVLKPFLSPDSGECDQKAAATTLGITNAALRVRLHRLRDLYRQYLRDEVRMTLSNPGESEIESELHELVAALS